MQSSRVWVPSPPSGVPAAAWFLRRHSQKGDTGRPGVTLESGFQDDVQIGDQPTALTCVDHQMALSRSGFVEHP